MGRGMNRLAWAAWATALALASAPLGKAAPAPTVHVAYAGSLALLNDKWLGPAFTAATGDSYQGQGGESFALAREIQAGQLHPQVLETIGTAPLAVLGTARIPWAVAVASSPLVVAYRPGSPYAPQLRAIAQGRRPLRDLFLLLRHPGVHLIRTDPATDPQGRAFVLMVELATRLYHLPADTPRRILGSAENPQQIFSEVGALSQLQAGAADVASAFLPECVQRHLPYVALPPALNFADPNEASLYASVSLRLPSGKTVRGAPLLVYAGPVAGAGESLGTRFVAFLLSARGRALLSQAGYPSVRPQLWGKPQAVPSSVRALLGVPGGRR